VSEKSRRASRRTPLQLQEHPRVQQHIEILLVDTCSFYDSLCQAYMDAFKRESGVGNFRKKVEGRSEFNFAAGRRL
jgi:hypothetical protein